MSCCLQQARKSLRLSVSRHVLPVCVLRKTSDQGRLEDVLQDAAVADAGSLPLLEFVLDGLFQAGRERRLLTFAAYRALGGLAGAIARRADELVGTLPQEVQDALPAVLRALMTVRDEEAITARPALLSQVAARPKQKALVDAMVAARLLVIDENPRVIRLSAWRTKHS